VHFVGLFSLHVTKMFLHWSLHNSIPTNHWQYSYSFKTTNFFSVWLPIAQGYVLGLGQYTYSTT